MDHPVQWKWELSGLGLEMAAHEAGPSDASVIASSLRFKAVAD